MKAKRKYYQGTVRIADGPSLLRPSTFGQPGCGMWCARIALGHIGE
jgi:hypothetical protein